MWMICHGKTPRCQRRAEERLSKYITRGLLRLTHQRSGWCDKTTAMQYLKWLRATRPAGQKLLLVWDVFSAHRDAEVKTEAARLNIELIFILAGMTDKWQPLDDRIFGSLKKRAQQTWVNDFRRMTDKFST
jgi:hypothetical protein